MGYVHWSFIAPLALGAMLAQADHVIGFGPMPVSLKNLPLPEVPGLLDGSEPIVTDKAAAIVLGKALFWDMNVGSDGVACASCHFHAGADRRNKNQISPVGQSGDMAKSAFGKSYTGELLGPNHSLSLADFPLHRRSAPLQESSTVIYDSDNVIGSAGTFGGDFLSVDAPSGFVDHCARRPDEFFQVVHLGTRRVTPRNAPSVINAVFNDRNFWDGRANNIFNGSSPWGDRDPNAGVWVKTSDGNIEKQRLHLLNSSLASLALAAPLNTTEMSCTQRSLPDIGRKLLPRAPLENQKVHWQDSVLAPYSKSTSAALQAGLNTTYEGLIKQAFHPKYWAYNGRFDFGAPAQGGQSYRQLEANFALFFGLAIQLYESTLISDEAPFDTSARDAEHQPIELSASALQGLALFRRDLCSHCHLGPNFTASAVTANAALAKSHPEVFGDATLQMSTTQNVIDRIPVVASRAFFDVGFAATGVASESNDIGLGAQDVFGNPLSFSQQYLQYLAGNTQAVVDEAVLAIRPCDFQIEFAVNYTPVYAAASVFTPAEGIRPQVQNTDRCFLAADAAFLPSVDAALRELNKADSQKMAAAVDGAFKIPSLRNVELTGPYMHNGSMATLEQVVEFYTRGGNFSPPAKQVTLVFSFPNLEFDAQNRADLVAFLKTLTDERVRYEKAPFDHPELWVSNGHIGNSMMATPYAHYPDFAIDEVLAIPAVGSHGSLQALLPFEAYLNQ